MVGRKLGTPPMPWQQLVYDVGGEYEFDEDGLIVPVYREIVVTVPRQNGKTVLVLTWECDRALNWTTRQRVIYTMQKAKDARDKLLTEQAPMLMDSGLRAAVANITRAKGEEAVLFRNGSRIQIEATGDDSGHGKVVDLAVLDETFADFDDRREQAYIPAMNTRDAAQILNCSTRGTDASLYHNRKVETCRALVDAGTCEQNRIAYFEWSADPSAPGFDPDDPKTWASCMPALGHTIRERNVRHARATMTDGEFRRAYLNIPTSGEDRMIPEIVWEAVQSEGASPAKPLVFAVDISEDRAEAAVAVAGGGVVGLAEHRPGTAWVVGWVKDNAKSQTVVVQQSGPAGALIPELERTGARIVVLNAADMAKACGAFYDDLADRKMTVRRHWKLDKAAAGVAKRQNGDAWVWDRRNATVDISPLVAVTAAHWQSSRIKATGGLFLAVT